MPMPAEPPRCPDHGLAIAADGMCVLCRRRAPARPWKGVVIATVTLLAAAAVVTLARPRGSETVSVEPEVVEPVPLARPADEAGAGELEAQRELAVAAHQRMLVEDRRRDAAARLAQAQAEEQRRLHEAMREVTITMYTTAWCPVCAKARSFLSANGFRFVDRDVEADPAARTIQRRLNPKGGVPTIDIEGEVLVGFGPRSLLAAIETAARRRLRR